MGYKLGFWVGFNNSTCINTNQNLSYHTKISTCISRLEDQFHDPNKAIKNRNPSFHAKQHLSKTNHGIIQITSFNPWSMFICKYKSIIDVWVTIFWPELHSKPVGTHELY